VHRIRRRFAIFRSDEGKRRQHDDIEGAERCFRTAIERAQENAARSFELRAAMSMSRLWRKQGRRAEARSLLAGAYDGFTEGFDTPDLVDARRLLGR